MYYDERKEVMPEAPVVLEPWRQHLLAAANLLRTDGWCQDTGSLGTRRCLQSAIAQVSNINAYRLANQKVGDYLGLPPYFSTASWNDIPGRTVKQVIAALEGAARA